MTYHTELEWAIAGLFEKVGRSSTTQPLEEQWYWSQVEELVFLAEGGLKPSYWVLELLRKLP